MPEFPAMLYKRGTQLEWDGERFDTIIVNDAEELEIAKADGWYVGKPPVGDEPAAKKARKADGEG